MSKSTKRKVLETALLVPVVLGLGSLIFKCIKNRKARKVLLTLLLLGALGYNQYVTWQAAREARASALTLTKTGIATTETILAAHLTTPYGELETWSAGGIGSDNITDDSIQSGDVKDGTLTTTDIKDLTIANVDVSASADIAGSKIDPDFGAQNIETTGTIQAGAGTAASPALRVSDADTGIYDGGSNSIAFSAGGSKVAEINANGLDPSGINFANDTSGDRDNSSWGYRGTITPTGVSGSSTVGWTDFDCDDYFTLGGGALPPTEEVLAIVWVQTSSNSSNTILYLRPNGASLWTVSYAPYCYARGSSGSDCGTFLMRTDTDHIFEYKATVTSGSYIIRFLGYIPIEPQ